MPVNNWPQPLSMESTMRQTEKRLQHQERRPIIRKAADLLGPGIGPYAVEIMDFNGETAVFNGMFVAAPGALNSPDTTKWWIGTVLATSDGSGIQEFRTFKDPDWPPLQAIRNFEIIASPFITYGTWIVT